MAEEAKEKLETTEKTSTDTSLNSAPNYRIIHNESAGQWEARLVERAEDSAENLAGYLAGDPAEASDESTGRESELGAVIAYLSYDLTDDSILLTSTVTVKKYQGFGIAGELVRTALNEIRAGGQYSVIPLCSYVAHFIEKHPEYGSMLAE